MRLVYYALGGGLGHLVRARAFLHTLGLTRDAVVLSASPFAEDARLFPELSLRSVPRALEHDRAAFLTFLHAELARHQADCLCVDSFPAGILGELCDFTSTRPLELWHVARLLRFDEYAKLMAGAPPRYARCYRVEPLLAEHEAFLAQHCERCEDLTLYAPSVESVAVTAPRDYWLVVHSGPEHELRELIAYTRDLQVAEGIATDLYVASFCRLSDWPDALQLDPLTAQRYFAGAQRIVTAAGFNLMRETAPFRHKQAVLPMPRRFDDQYARARRFFGSFGDSR